MTKKSKLVSLGYIEIILIQCIIWIGLWLYDDYLGSLLTAIMVPIFIGILIISLISEWIEASKVPRSYFVILFLSIFIPLFIGIFVFIAYDGVFDWLLEL